MLCSRGLKRLAPKLCEHLQSSVVKSCGTSLKVMKEISLFLLLGQMVKQFLQSLILIFLELQRSAENCRELHGAPLGPVVLGSASCMFRGGYHRQPGLPRFGVCQDVSCLKQFDGVRSM